MIDELTREQAALYALDFLPPDEREDFARRVEAEAHPELAILVDEYRAAAAKLVLALPQEEPPAQLRANVLAAVRSPG